MMNTDFDWIQVRKGEQMVVVRCHTKRSRNSSPHIQALQKLESPVQLMSGKKPRLVWKSATVISDLVDRNKLEVS